MGVSHRENVCSRAGVGGRGDWKDSFGHVLPSSLCEVKEVWSLPWIQRRSKQRLVKSSAVMRSVFEERIEWKRHENALRQVLTHQPAVLSEKVPHG